MDQYLRAFLLLISLSLTILTTAFGQKLNTDSLASLIHNSKEDTTRVLAMRKLASYQIIHENKAEVGLALLNKAEQVAKKISYQRGICEVLLTRGNYHYGRSEWGKAVECFTDLSEQSELITQPLNKRRTKMIALNNLGGIYSKNGDYAKALDYYLKSRVLLEKMNADATALCTIYMNIGTHYSLLDQDKKANEYLDLCYPLLKKAKPDLTYMYWYRKVELADKEKKAVLVKSMIDSLKKNVKSNQLSKYQNDEYRLELLEMEGMYQEVYLKNREQAIKIYQTKLALAKKLENTAETHYCNNKIGEIYYNLNNYDLATTYLRKAYNGAKKDSIQIIAISSS